MRPEGDQAHLSDDERWMRRALREAEKAADAGDVPVGAVVVHEGRLIGRAHNQRELLTDPTAHAEMIAITQAAEALESWRLTDATMYVTLEPCLMCAGAIHWSRLAGLVFGAPQPESGVFGSKMDMVEARWYHPGLWVERGLRAEQSRELLRLFFEEQRVRNADAP